MERTLDGWHSPYLNRPMEIVSYGHAGFPLLMFPTAAADYLEYERFYVIEVIREFIEAGKVQVFSINSINRRSWLNRQVPVWEKGQRQVEYNYYITEEVVPYIRNRAGDAQAKIITAGASLGAFHAANQLLRRPDIFDGGILMSGSYDIKGYYDGDYYDSNIYFNNPVDFLPGLNDDYYLPLLREKKHIHIVTGQGSYENPDASKRLAGLLWTKGIPFDLDLWGFDMPHDWPTWRSIMKFYLGAKF